MKTSNYFFLFLNLAAIGYIQSGCSKSNTDKDVLNKDSEVNIHETLSSTSYTPLATALSNMQYLGAVEDDLPGWYSPEFTGYSQLRYFVGTSNDRYFIYVWDTEAEIDPEASAKCGLTWHGVEPDVGCYNPPAAQCYNEVIYDGQGNPIGVRIICCD
jgi:hypothetical protein